jgi:hypothetical protein
MVGPLGHANGEFCRRQQVIEMLAGLDLSNIAVVATEQTAGIILERVAVRPGPLCQCRPPQGFAHRWARQSSTQSFRRQYAAVDEGGPDVDKVSQHLDESRPDSRRI